MPFPFDTDIDDSGYDLSDPKHPSWRERMAERGDLTRKRQLENPQPKKFCVLCGREATAQVCDRCCE